MGDIEWAQVGARETLLFTLCFSGAAEPWAAYAAIALPKSLAGHGVNLVVSLSCERSFRLSGRRRG